MSRRKKERVSWHPEALTALVLSLASFFAVLLSLDAVAAPLSHLADEDPAAWFVDGSWIVQICLLFGDLLFSWYMNDNQIKWGGLLASIDGHLARYPWGPEARPILARPEHGTGPNIIGLGPARAR